MSKIYSTKTPQSSVIKEIQYNSRGVLTILFRSGNVYDYAVGSHGKRTYERFKNAKSVGRHFNLVIRKFYGPSL